MLVTFVDLFCGIGGIRLGMEKVGFNCVMSSDHKHRMSAYILRKFW